MKLKSILATMVAGLAISTATHAATYSFTGFFGEPLPPGQTDYTATFSFSTAGYITSDTVILASAMKTCTTHASACASATFYSDAAAAGLAPAHPEWEAIGFTSQYSTSYYYFDAPTFTVDGTHTSVFGVGPGTLTISPSAIPEPSQTILLGAGLPLLFAAFTRRRYPSKR